MHRKYILFHAVNATEDVFFGEGSRDNAAEPFIAFKRRCAELGYTLDMTRDQPLDEIAWIIFWDVDSLGPQTLGDRLRHFAKVLLRKQHPFRNILREATRTANRPGLALIVAEPPSILRRNVRTKPHQKMDVVFTWNEEWLRRGGKYMRTVLPVANEFPQVRRIPFEEKKLIVDISANKSSSHPKELYSARREAIQFFQNNLPDDFHLFGIGWEGYPAYRGRVNHKWDVLPKYRFAICYENAVLDDYISQRVFDVLRCGCVPIYWGATNVEKYIDAGAFVDRRRFSSNEELAEYLKRVSKAEYEAMLDAGQRFLRSDRFRRFLGSSWGENLLAAIGIREEARKAVSS